MAKGCKQAKLPWLALLCNMPRLAPSAMQVASKGLPVAHELGVLMPSGAGKRQGRARLPAPVP